MQSVFLNGKLFAEESGDEGSDDACLFGILCPNEDLLCKLKKKLE